MNHAQFQKLHAQVPASKDEKQLVAGYLRRRPGLRQSMKKAPPSPLNWWHLLHVAQRDAGLVFHPLIRPI